MIEYLKKKYSVFRTDVLTMPYPFYQNKLKSDNLKQLNLLKKKGYLGLGKILTDETINKAQKLISEKQKKGEAFFIEKQNIWKISNLDDFEFVIEDFFSNELIFLINDYFKRKIYLSDIDIRRVMPIDYEEVSKLGNSNSDWHRDTRGRQLKIMIYLSKVTNKDSFFSFIPGTHKHKTYDFEESRFTADEIKKSGLEEVKWFGNEGEGMIFDTNIKHRLNRQSSANIRDTMTFYFTPGQSLRKICRKEILFKNSNDKKIYQMLNKSFFEDRT